MHTSDQNKCDKYYLKTIKCYNKDKYNDGFNIK